MLIYACTLILTITCKSIAFSEKESTPNVGTVLFTPTDLQKKQWAKAEIGLLRARRYFQTLLPPPIFINTFNEEYVNILLEYFRDAYSNIKREADDTETDTIMTTALSDAIGGYLKVWVLPVAKLDYYGGTVSQENMLKLFQFYNEIKRYLDTDGAGWLKPDENVLNSVTINVAPLKLTSNTRSMKDPCEDLAYFEKTDKGISIPIPNVNWNDKFSTLFIPLKNVSLIPMNMPDSSHNLIKYYDAARSCIRSTYPKEQREFDDKFQNWLTQDVVPHLKDENLYLALGSVLTLVNRTRDLCNAVLSLLGNNISNNCEKNKTPPPCSPVDLRSKKLWIMAIIVIIEIAWCIPALIYIVISKRIQKKDSNSNVYLFIDSKNPSKKSFVYKSKCRDEDNPSSTPVENQCCGPCGTKSACVITDTVKTGMRPLVKEQSSCPKTCEYGAAKKSSMKKTSAHNIPSDHTKSTRMMALSSQDAFKLAAIGSYSTFQGCVSPAEVVTPYCIEIKRENVPIQEDLRKLEKRKLLDESKKREQRKLAAEYKRLEDNNNQLYKKLQEHKKAEQYRSLPERSKSEKYKTHEKREDIQENRTDSDTPKLNECLVQEIEYDTIEVETCEFNIPKVEDDTSECYGAGTGLTESPDTGTDSTLNLPCHCTACVVKTCKRSLSSSTVQEVTSESISITTSFKTTKELKTTKGKQSMYFSSGKSCSEAMIESPATETSSDVAKLIQNSRPVKPSRIPKLSYSNVVQPLTGKSGKQPKTSNETVKHKSLIPQPKRKTVDDLSLTRCHCVISADSKLNETF